VTQESDRVRLDRTNEPQADVPRAELLELYKVVIDEYRFQLRLNWDRTQYYFVFNTAMVTAAATVLATLKAWGAVVSLFMFVLGGTSAVSDGNLLRKGMSITAESSTERL
jgi:hypothetical protein